MRLAERAFPVRMRRVAVVVGAEHARDVLVEMARLGVVHLSGPLGTGEGPALEALRRLETERRGVPSGRPALVPKAPDVGELERRGARDLLAGEVELERRRAGAVRHGDFLVFVGWAPRPALPPLQDSLDALGAAMVELRAPAGRQPPTLLAPAPAADPFRPLLTTYGAVPYADVDPTPFVAVTYCLMFGMMFGDVGDGLLIVLAALALRHTRSRRLATLRRVWPMIAAAGAAAVLFGALYGELFGPTKVLPTLWLAPLDSPTRLLAVAIVAGVGLLAASHLIGIVNRYREGGPALALTTDSGVPGLLLLAGSGLVALGIAGHGDWLEPAGLLLMGVAVVPLLFGLRADAGSGPTAILEVLIGLLDSLLRLFSNVFSFARLAAFGLMHAAIGQVVLHAAGSLTGSALGDLAAVLTFAVGWTAAFALEGLVVSVQALRLEYYELFSRLFVGEGRPFRPFRLPLIPTEEAR
jgi:V/A-type H+/Na+-transporting ATPase subunit I